MSEKHFTRIFLGGATFVRGAFTTRAVVRSTYGGDDLEVGSIAISSTDGRVYIKVADSGADTDWNKVTATDAD